MGELTSEDPAAIGPYRLTGRLGEGGMGRVYLAQSRGGRRIAVKVVRPEIAADPGFRERFRREVAAARAVGGFWTAPIVDADPDAAAPWVASDYIAAPSLAERVTEYGPYARDELVSLAAGLAEALEAVHRAGLVHRDLKPSNILVTDDGPRVIDFGISKAMEGLTALTDTGLVIGSPGFMSPEQASGGFIGPPSDIFSLGAVLVFASTGLAPFGEGSVPALLYRVVHETPSLNGVPAELRGVLAVCLEKEPERRPTPGKLLDLLSGTRPPAPPPRDQRHETTTVPAPAPAQPTGATAAPYARVAMEAEGQVEAGLMLIRIGILILLGFLVWAVLAGGGPQDIAIPLLLGGGMTTTGIFVRGFGLRHPRDIAIEVTARGLTYVRVHFHWSASWEEIRSVSLTRFRAVQDNEIYWEVRATFDADPQPSPRVPAPFRVSGTPNAVRNVIKVPEATARAELAPLDAALRQYAPDRYHPDPALITLLNSP